MVLFGTFGNFLKLSGTFGLFCVLLEIWGTFWIYFFYFVLFCNCFVLFESLWKFCVILGTFDYYCLHFDIFWYLPDPRGAGLHLAFQFSYVRPFVRSSVRPSARL